MTSGLRPIALTSILCKCKERVIVGRLTSPHCQLDNLQFAYKAQRGTEDATLTHYCTWLLKISSILILCQNLIYWLFSFNTIRIDILLNQLHCALWIKFLYLIAPKESLYKAPRLMKSFWILGCPKDAFYLLHIFLCIWMKCKYLGILASNLNFNERSDYIKTAIQRLFLLRKWNGFVVSK